MYRQLYHAEALLTQKRIRFRLSSLLQCRKRANAVAHSWDYRAFALLAYYSAICEATTMWFVTLNAPGTRLARV